MLQSASNISFKRTYIDRSYKKMNLSQKQTANDIYVALQISDSNNESLESYYEKRGRDFYIEEGSNDNVDLYIVNRKKDDDSYMLIGSYNKDKSFKKSDVKRSVLLAKSENWIKFAAAVLLALLYVECGIKLFMQNPAARKLPDVIIGKIFGH